CLFFSCSASCSPESYTLSLHDALPIFEHLAHLPGPWLLVDDEQAAAPGGRPGTDRVVLVEVGHERVTPAIGVPAAGIIERRQVRSEEHTSELQSRSDLVCRLLLEKKKK